MEVGGPTAEQNHYLAHTEYLIALTCQKQEDQVMTRPEELTEEEQLNLKNALEHIEELQHLMEKRPVETFRALMKLNLPMELEIQIEKGTYVLKLNESD